jgi:hypothetical protein
MLDVEPRTFRQLHAQRLHSSAGGWAMSTLWRTLSIKTADTIISVPVGIEPPTETGGSWRCDFSIGWPEETQRGYGMGYDAVQALYMALGAIAIWLYASPYHAAGTLYWDKPGLGYGFLLPPGGRDLAVGDDRRL